MVRNGTVNYILGVLTNPKSILNMYIYGSIIIASIKILLAIIGVYSSAIRGSYEPLFEFLLIYIETLLPIFISLDGGFLRIGEMVITFLLNIAVGVFVAAAKWDMATR